MNTIASTVLLQLLEVDTKSLVSVLFWGNLVSAALVFSFRLSTPFSRTRPHTSYFLWAKTLQASAFLLLFSRGHIPDLLSVNLGNTLLFAGFYCEARSLLQIIQADSLRVRRACAAVTTACIILFNAAEALRPGDPAFRVLIASVCVFLTLCIPTERLLRFPDASHFKKVVGLFYLVFLAMLLPRATVALFRPIGLLSNSLIQTLTLLSMVLLLVFSLAAYLLLLKEESDKALHEMATRDSLTGLPNRLTFLASARLLFDRHIGGAFPIALIVFNLDDFKNVNSIWGDNFGDFFLKSFAASLGDTIRSTDIPCRYANEDFFLLLPETDAQMAKCIGEHVAVALKKKFMQQETGVIFTVSGGVAACIPKQGDTLDELIRRAHLALHIATTTGKDKIVMWKER